MQNGTNIETDANKGRRLARDYREAYPGQPAELADALEAWTVECGGDPTWSFVEAFMNVVGPDAVRA